MPIYEYACRDCGQQFEALVRAGEQPACPACGKQNLSKQFSAPAAHTGGTRDPNCPARDSCGSPKCGGSCEMGQWM